MKNIALEDLKREAAYRAVDDNVRSGMILGLGTGSTACWAVRRIGELLVSGDLEDVRGIPTSSRTAALAGKLNIPLTTLSEARPLFTIDGADEIDPSLTLIKGRGGALLREKIVAASSERGLIAVADSTKLVGSLGQGTLPVEIDSFGWEATLEALATLGCVPELRRLDEAPFVTDGGHYTADCRFPGIPNPRELEGRIKNIPGALETGIFSGLAHIAYVGHPEGVERLTSE